MGKVYTCLTHRWIEQLIRTINETYDLNRWCIVNVFHDGRDYVAVKVRDDATNEDIEKAINVAYLDDDCEVLEQRLHEITNIKVEEK